MYEKNFEIPSLDHWKYFTVLNTTNERSNTLLSCLVYEFYCKWIKEFLPAVPKVLEVRYNVFTYNNET